MRAAEIYQDRFSTEDNKIFATIELITLTGWAPADSQPKPQRRGTATIDLEQALENYPPNKS